MSEPIPFCSVAYGDEFFAKQHWVNNYTAADEDARLAHLINSTKVIQTFVKFFAPAEPPSPPEGGLLVDLELPPPSMTDREQIFYNPTSADGDESIPDWLKEACCYEALYFFDLENDPSRPYSLGILGIIKDGTTVFDHNYEPPLFSKMALQILLNNGGVVFDPSNPAKTAPKNFMQ